MHRRIQVERIVFFCAASADKPAAGRYNVGIGFERHFPADHSPAHPLDIAGGQIGVDEVADPADQLGPLRREARRDRLREWRPCCSPSRLAPALLRLGLAFSAGDRGAPSPPTCSRRRLGLVQHRLVAALPPAGASLPRRRPWPDRGRRRGGSGSGLSLWLLR